jgi:DNA repair protein RadC
MIEKIFRLGVSPSVHRFRVIRPVYETIAVEECVEGYQIDTPISASSTIFTMFKFLAAESKEHAFTLHLDSKNKLLCFEHISTGSMSASVVHPREVYKSSLLSSASSIIMIHNHPSGDTTPSSEDHEITKRLKEAGELLGIRFLDHVIIGNGYYSFADRGTL